MLKLTGPQRKFAMMVSMSIPVLYMVGLHIYWMGERNARLRMLTKHVGFWGGMGLTIYTAHRLAYRAKSGVAALAWFGAASLFPILGYEAFRRLGPKLFPKRKKTLLPPDLFSALAPSQPSAVGKSKVGLVTDKPRFSINAPETQARQNIGYRPYYGNGAPYSGYPYPTYTPNHTYYGYPMNPWYF